MAGATPTATFAARDGRLAQAGELEPGGDPLVLTFDGLAVDHHCNALREGERGDVWLSPLFLQRLGHTGEPERDRAIVGGMREHIFSCQ
jgi:hypothetical protein